MGVRKVRRTISAYSILDKASYALVFLAGISFMLSNVAQTPTPVGIITSRSMEPLMTIGDIVFTQPIAIEDVKVGDIIAYYSPPDNTIIHRVVEIKIYSGKILLITQGDANPVTDQSLGFPPVTANNLIGKVFCLDGIPFRIPIIGEYVIHARNFAIWLTQNKIWAFWGPLVAIIYVFGPYLSPRGISQFNFRRSLRSKIPVKKLLIYTLIAFLGISAFTFYFKTEAYTLAMRVACLLETKQPTYISFGSMTYGEERNNTIEVTGAPLFPVKAVSMIRGNASRLVTCEPRTMIVEPQEFTSLNLRAKIPARGEVEPGIYTGTVYIFSDTLLILLPDSIIFSAFYAMPDPWATVIVLDLLVASLLAFSIAFLAVTINTTSAQILYTMVWHDKLERGFPSKFRMKMHNLRAKLSRVNQKISRKLSLVSLTIRREVELKKMLKPAGIAAVPAAMLFILLDNLLVPILTLGAVISILLWRMRVRKKSELVASVFFANILLAATFITRRSVTILYAQINAFWCLVSASFVGDLSYLVTVPILLVLTLVLVFGLDWGRVWYTEHQTLSWQKMKSGITKIKKTIYIPSLEEFERLKRRRIKIRLPPVPSEASILMGRVGGSFRVIFRRASSSLQGGFCVASVYLKPVKIRFIEEIQPIVVALVEVLENIRDWIEGVVTDIQWSIRIRSNKSILYPYIEGEL